MPVADDPVVAYRGAVAPVVEWLGQRARGLALSVRDGSVDFALPGAAPLKLDAVMLDGNVSSDAVEVKIAARGSLWQNARLHATIATGSLAVTAELDVDDLDAAAVFARVLDQATMRLDPAASDLTLALSTDGARSANGQLSFATPAFSIMRNGTRLDLGAARARVTASYAPEDTTVRVDELKLGDMLTAGSGALKIKPGAGGVALEAALGRVDAGRMRAAALAVAGDVAIVGAVTSIVRSGIASDLKLNAVTDRVAGLADLSAYDVSMGVEAAAFDIPTPAMPLTGASGRVRIARGGADSGERRRQRRPFEPSRRPARARARADGGAFVAFGGARPRPRRKSRACPTPAGQCPAGAGDEPRRIYRRPREGHADPPAGWRRASPKLRRDGPERHIAVRQNAASGRDRQRRSALRDRGRARAAQARRFDRCLPLRRARRRGRVCAGAVARSASGAATLALDELYPWIATLPAGEALRREVGALQGSVGVKLARLAGPLAAPGRLEIDAVLTPHMVHATSPRLPSALTVDGGAVRVQNQDLVCDGVDFALRDLRATLSGTVRGLATPAPAFDVSIARATIGPRILDWAANEADVPRGARPTAPIRLERTRIRWPAPAPWRFDVAGAASFPGGTRSEFDLSYRPGSVAAPAPRAKGSGQRRARHARLGAGPRGTLVPRPRVGTLDGANPRVAAEGHWHAARRLRGDGRFDRGAPSRATGKLEGTGIDLTEALEFPLALDRITLEADGERVRVRDTSLRFADQPFELQGSIARTGDATPVDATVTTDAIDTQRWLDRLPLAAVDADRASRGKWPVRGRVAMRAGHVDVLGYRWSRSRRTWRSTSAASRPTSRPRACAESTRRSR